MLRDGKEQKHEIVQIAAFPIIFIIDCGLADNPLMREVATSTTSATFQINNTKLYGPVVILSINDNIKILENVKQEFKRTISWNKYRSEIKIQEKNNNLDYLIDPRCRNINRLSLLSFKYGKDDPTRNCFDKCYMTLVEIKDFNALVDNKLFFIS